MPSVLSTLRYYSHPPDLAVEVYWVIDIGPYIGKGVLLNADHVDLLGVPDRDHQCWIQIFEGPFAGELTCMRRFELEARGYGCVEMSLKTRACANCKKMQFADLPGKHSKTLGAQARLKMCVRCKVVYSCDADCQRLDWQRHMNECRRMRHHE